MSFSLTGRELLGSIDTIVILLVRLLPTKFVEVLVNNFFSTPGVFQPDTV